MICRSAARGLAKPSLIVITILEKQLHFKELNLQGPVHSPTTFWVQPSTIQIYCSQIYLWHKFNMVLKSLTWYIVLYFMSPTWSCSLTVDGTGMDWTHCAVQETSLRWMEVSYAVHSPARYPQKRIDTLWPYTVGAGMATNNIQTACGV